MPNMEDQQPVHESVDCTNNSNNEFNIQLDALHCLMFKLAPCWHREAMMRVQTNLKNIFNFYANNRYLLTGFKIQDNTTQETVILDSIFECIAIEEDQDDDNRDVKNVLVHDGSSRVDTKEERDNDSDFVEVHSCNKCTRYTTLDIKRFERHISTVHGKDGGKAEEICENCGKMLRANSIKSHFNTCPMLHNLEHRRNFKCEQCHWSFSNKPNLKEHIRRIHENKHRHLCSQCPAKFYSVDEVENHTYCIHKINISSKPIATCPTCGYTALQGTRFRKHLKTHLKGSFSCNLCDKVFATDVRRKTHQRAHTAPKKFKCDTCDYSSKKRYAVERHAIMKHNQMCWDCSICPYKAHAKHNLVAHYNNIHSCDPPKCGVTPLSFKPVPAESTKRTINVVEQLESNIDITDTASSRVQVNMPCQSIQDPVYSLPSGLQPQTQLSFSSMGYC